MNHRILITGSSGLIGTALTSALLAKGAHVVQFDLKARGRARGDIRDRDSLQKVVASVDGIVHLAAVSRVIWGERAPDLCCATNIDGLRNLLELAAKSNRVPWVIVASSREVYGQPDLLPATEDCPLRPINVYGRTKVRGELLVEEACRAGIRASIIRLSNVFGSTADHANRVVPAFARAATLGKVLRVDGFDSTFDFTHIDDVTHGITALVNLLSSGESPPPPIQFVSGKPTTLGELANLAIQLGQSGSTIKVTPSRDFDVARFYGDPTRAKTLLGWQPLVGLEEGIARLVHAFRGTHQKFDSTEAV
jgi:nucleoside-diphosphate-sugar epimerase